MRRWGARGLHLIAWRRPAIHPPPAFPLLPRQFHTIPARCAEIHERRTDRSPIRLAPSRKYAIFKRIVPPERTADAWTALLDSALPPHLRDPDIKPPLLTLAATDVAEILLAAQYPEDTKDEGIDLLCHLGFQQGRWNAVVWLVKKLIDEFPVRHGQDSSLAQLAPMWNRLPDLDTVSVSAIEADEEMALPSSGLIEARSLNELTRNTRDRSQTEFGHEALGQIWRTLGAMTRACIGGEIRSEVLEIIAYLHHREIMPLSIYQSEPHSDKSAIQQPPLLPFLSSRILTSLSDAAWRAHEKLVVEQSKANGSEFAALRPELPGTAYRIHVAGLRCEVWMELILWSCLYGGWVRQGSEILLSLVQERVWTPISWKQYEQSHSSHLSSESNEWNTWEYIFKTRAGTTMDAPQGATKTTERTMSAELVNAYIDALASSVHPGVGSIGIPIASVLPALILLKYFLSCGQHLSLSFSTWESLIVRLFETQAIVPEQDIGLLRDMIFLSRRFGQILKASNAEGLPTYALDGTFVIQGFLNRALRGQIATGSLESAVEIFSIMQQRADFDKQRSMFDFFNINHKLKLRKGDTRAKASLFHALSTASDMFTSNLSGIEYPAFNVQVPTTTLGAFLDLALDNESYDFARWLLYNDDLDGPMISKPMYRDLYVQPAIVRFAAETNDEQLLRRLRGMKIQKSSLRAMLNTQFNNMRWDAAVHILGHMRTIRGMDWSPENLANLARVMCSLEKDTASGDPQSGDNFQRARAIFEAMLKLRYEGVQSILPARATEVQSVLTTLTAIDSTWAKLCRELRVVPGHHKLNISATSFNHILKGVVATRGSAAGRRLLEVFWPPSARLPAVMNRYRTKAPQSPVASSRSSIMEKTDRNRIVVQYGSSSRNALVTYGAARLTADTILIILRKAFEELSDLTSGEESKPKPKSNSSPFESGFAVVEPCQSPREMVIWAVRRLAEVPYVENGIVRKLDSFLAVQGMEEIRAELPEIYRSFEMGDDSELLNEPQFEAGPGTDDNSDKQSPGREDDEQIPDTLSGI